MNLNQLGFAAAVAVERSFSRAAERCRVTQPTLSSGVALLEEEIGGQLFVRTTRKVDLSPFGEQMLPLIEAVLRAQTELEAGIRAFYDPSRKIARIGLSPLADARLVARVLEPYRAEHPETEAFFKECLLGDLDERLRASQLDLAIRPSLAPGTVRKAFVRVPLYEEDLFYLPRATGDAAATESSIRLEDAARETFVLPADGCGLAAATRSLFEDARLGLRAYPGQALSYAVLQEWADLGIGATILPESKIAPAFRKRARRLMLTTRKPARVAFEAAWMKNAAYPRHVAELHRHFRQRVPKLVRGAVP
jgi:LysR family transcriptional regulator, hydrogen peroxide-inducible genes activator